MWQLLARDFKLHYSKQILKHISMNMQNATTKLASKLKVRFVKFELSTIMYKQKMKKPMQ